MFTDITAVQLAATTATWLIAGALTVLALLLLLVLLIHLGFRAPRLRERATLADAALGCQSVSIPTLAGKQLFGWLLSGSNNRGATSTLIILHGWGSNAGMMLPLALPFQRAGMNVLLFDARNHGRSDSHGHSSLPRFAEDLDHVIYWLRQTHPASCRKLAVLGHSVGAAAALLSVARRRDIDAVIAIATFAHPEWMMQRYLQGLYLPALLRRAILRYVEWVIGHRFDAIAPLNTACRIACPILLIHGQADRTVPVSDAYAIVQACPQANIQLLLVDGADHDSVDRIEEHEQELLDAMRAGGLLD